MHIKKTNTIDRVLTLTRHGAHVHVLNLLGTSQIQVALEKEKINLNTPLALLCLLSLLSLGEPPLLPPS